MKISISQKYKPFLHLPGSSVIVPGTRIPCKIYPIRIVIYGEWERIIELPLSGPVKDFTVQLDLEEGCIRVFGTFQQGYVRYFICGQEDGVHLFLDKGPDFLKPFFSEKTKTFPKLDKQERLSFGSHKAQDMELIRRRVDVLEILPLWYSAAAWLPPRADGVKVKEGNFQLLDAIAESIEKNDKNTIEKAWQSAYLASFESLLFPRVVDSDFQGICLDPLTKSDKDIDFCLLLKMGAHLIRRMLFWDQGEKVHILPCLPPEFHCGRMIGIDSRFGEWDIEWSKKLIRRVFFKPFQEGEVLPLFQKSVKTYRLRKGRKDKGKRVDTGSVICFKAGESIFFDNFQK